MFTDLLIPATATARNPHIPEKRGAKIARLRALIKTGGHLHDPAKGLTQENVRPYADIAAQAEVSSSFAHVVIRKEFPEIAQAHSQSKISVARCRAIRAEKLPKFHAYLEEGQHLRATEEESEDWRRGVIDLEKVKTHREIAQDLSIDSSTVSSWLHEFYPELARTMTARQWFHVR